ncbi:uncharacterized protein LOC125896823 [Epinephelus fuscoguttatus]|uniref:uncharacterized protein LOC125896823 n=1 Tax=Epinephelus fuscoguttatus TaxID=293821 RepID=UPI0020D10D24|nr:uncharacterized protein LOC125896823 [Epinephelus fuscoguttatus]
MSDMYSALSDEELDVIIAEIHQSHPNTGYRMMKSFLHARGLLVQITRVHDSLKRVDPIGNEVRAMANRTLRRRQYSTPNAMWHIDGKHKLIRWRFVVHGGIDGFSRLIVYLSAATNNQAYTVLESFIDGIDKFGLSSCVRSDKGGENIEVAQFMVKHRGESRNSHITGRSVHNQRIECLWRDVYIQVLDPFHVLFRNLERERMLNPDDESHLFALHWAFLPQLQEIRYNKAHIRTRNIVERTFGILNSRFRCLDRTGGALLYRPEKVAQIVVTCCMLHNIAKQHGLEHNAMPEENADLPILEQQPNAAGMQTCSNLI